MAANKCPHWLERMMYDTSCISYEDVSAEAVNIIAAVLPTMRRSMYRTDRLVHLLSDPAVPYDTVAKLFAAVAPAADAARIVASERRMSALAQVAALPGREPEVYEAVVSAFGKAEEKSSARSCFGVLEALLTNPDVSLAAKAAAAAVPSVYAWAQHVGRDTSAHACWDELMSSEQLQTAAFDGLTLPDHLLMECASWQRLSTKQLRKVFGRVKRQIIHEPVPANRSDPGRLTQFTGFVEPYRLPEYLLKLSDHPTADDEFLAELDDWSDKFPFPDDRSICEDEYFLFTFRKHRRQKQRVDPAEFWATHPGGEPEQLTHDDWSHWTRIGSMPELVEVLALEPDGWRDVPVSDSWLAVPLGPLMSSASAAADIPQVLEEVEELVWWWASYEALTFDVLRCLHPSRLRASQQATIRLLELLSATLGPDPSSWSVFEKVSVPDASIGEILDLAAQIADC